MIMESTNNFMDAVEALLISTAFDFVKCLFFMVLIYGTIIFILYYLVVKDEGFTLWEIIRNYLSSLKNFLVDHPGLWKGFTIIVIVLSAIYGIKFFCEVMELASQI